ncbi:unnamed protein product [Boreogadus saida]
MVENAGMKIPLQPPAGEKAAARGRYGTAPPADADVGTGRPCYAGDLLGAGNVGSPTIPARVMNRDTQALLDTGSVVTLLRPDLAGGKAGNRWRWPASTGTPGPTPRATWLSAPHNGVVHDPGGDCTPPPGSAPNREGLPDSRRLGDPAQESRDRRDVLAVAARGAAAAAARDAAAAARDAAAAAVRDAAAAAGDTRSLVYLRLGQRVEECGIPPRKPRPGRARGTVKDGVYHPHPPAGDGEQPFRFPNQGDWGTPGRKARSHLKRRSRTARQQRARRKKVALWRERA